MSKNIKIETYVSDKLTMDYIKFGHGSNTLVILPGLSVQSVMLLADAVADAYDCMTNDFTIYLFDRRKNLILSVYKILLEAETDREVCKEKLAVYRKLLKL